MLKDMGPIDEGLSFDQSSNKTTARFHLEKPNLFDYLNPLPVSYYDFYQIFASRFFSLVKHMSTFTSVLSRDVSIYLHTANQALQTVVTFSQKGKATTGRRVCLKLVEMFFLRRHSNYILLFNNVSVNVKGICFLCTQIFQVTC